MRLWKLIPCAWIAVVMSGCGTSSGDDTALRRIRDTDSIRIGYAVEPPFALLNEGGVVGGESPEVARRIVARLGVHHVDWIQTDFDALIPGLESGRFDVIAAGMFITPQRARRVSFSEPTLHVRAGLLVTSGNPRHLTSYADAVADAAVKVAVIAGSVEEAALRAAGLPESRLASVPDALTGRVGVTSGAVAALALSSPSVHWMAAHDPTRATQPVLLSEAGTGGFGAFAFRRAETSLLSAWNVALKEFVGSEEHLRIIVPLGFDRSELPGSMTTAQVIGR